jgi:hypothetical protein
VKYQINVYLAVRKEGLTSAKQTKVMEIDVNLFSDIIAA